MVASSYVIRHGDFVGPFELLLELVDRRKLSVSELSLASVTDEYIAFVRGHEAFPMEEATRFVGVAATLLLIKSRSLIPELELSSEEEGDMEELQRRLLRYEALREAREALRPIAGKRVLLPAGERKQEPRFQPSPDLSPAAIAAALAALLESREKEAERLPEARVRPLVSLEETMEKLRVRVQHAMSLSFKEFSAGAAERVEVIVSFLALLELVKQGAVEADQHGAFEDIRITNAAAALPRY